MQVPRSTHITQTYIHSMFIETPEKVEWWNTNKMMIVHCEIKDKPGDPKAKKSLIISPNSYHSEPGNELSAPKLHTSLYSEYGVFTTWSAYLCSPQLPPSSPNHIQPHFQLSMAETMEIFIGLNLESPLSHQSSDLVGLKLPTPNNHTQSHPSLLLAPSVPEWLRHSLHSVSPNLFFIIKS